MDTSENAPVTEPRAGMEDGRRIEELQRACSRLQSLLNWSLLAIIILSASFFLFLFRDMSLIRRQSNELTAAIAEFEEKNLPVMRQFRDQLEAYAQTNPEFRPILRRYLTPPEAGESGAGNPVPVSTEGSGAIQGGQVAPE